MTNTAAHLVDRVLPNVPIRQWVLSLPFDLRAVAARNPSLVTAVDRLLFREVERWMRRTGGPSEARAGAVTFVRRFGGSLNLHVHFHVLFLEGLFTGEPERLAIFHADASRATHDDRAVAYDDEPSGIGRQSVSLDGFNLHAAVRVGADDDVARERLVRY